MGFVYGSHHTATEAPKCPVCGEYAVFSREAELKPTLAMKGLVSCRVGCTICDLYNAHTTDDKNAAFAEWETGKIRVAKLDTVVFPSDYFNPEAVDPDLQAEYDAVLENEALTPVLFSYEAWFERGKLALSDASLEFLKQGSSSIFEKAKGAVYRGWMMKPEQYARFYEELRKHNIFLMTLPEEYSALHLFPNVYAQVREDSARIQTFPLHTHIDIADVLESFPRFMVKDYVKSVKGTEFPSFFDENVTQEEFDRWMEVFYKYRGDLLTGGICIKEYLDLKRYGGKTNEHRAFYANGETISLSPNSGQGTLALKPPQEFVNKYKNLGSPFYTVDYAELADGSWRVIETGDGGVSGLSDGQDAGAFFRALHAAF